MREMLEIYIGFWRSCSSSPFAIYPCSFGKHAGPKVEIFRERSWAYITFLFWSFVGTLRKVIENRYYLCECLTLSVSVGSGGEEGNAAQNNGRWGVGTGTGTEMASVLASVVRVRCGMRGATAAMLPLLN